MEKKCGALALAKEFLPTEQIHDFTSSSKEIFESKFLEWSQKEHPTQKPLIILVGYFRLITESFLKEVSAVINTHPSLLPAFPGLDKKVHEAAFENSLVSGFSVHLVNEDMDAGPIVFQKSISTSNMKSAEEMREAVRSLEQKYLPQVINQLLKTDLEGADRQLTTRQLQNKEGFPIICVD